MSPSPLELDRVRTLGQRRAIGAYWSTGDKQSAVLVSVDSLLRKWRCVCTYTLRSHFGTTGHRLVQSSLFILSIAEKGNTDLALSGPARLTRDQCRLALVVVHLFLNPDIRYSFEYCPTGCTSVSVIFGLLIGKAKHPHGTVCLRLQF